MHLGQELWVQGSQWNAFGGPSNLHLHFHPQISVLRHWHPFPWPPSPIQEEWLVLQPLSHQLRESSHPHSFQGKGRQPDWNLSMWSSSAAGNRAGHRKERSREGWGWFHTEPPAETMRIWGSQHICFPNGVFPFASMWSACVCKQECLHGTC